MPKVTRTKRGKFQYRSKAGKAVGKPKSTRKAARRVGRKKK